MSTHIDVRLEIEDVPSGTFEVARARGHEAISRLFEMEILAVLREKDWIDPEQLLGRRAALVFEREGAELRRMFGVIARVRDRMETESEAITYELRFVPRAHRLTLVETLDIHLDMTLPDILRKKLADHGFAERSADGGEHDFELRMSRSYPARELVVQYKETDLAFLSRLCEHHGVSFFFEHAGDRDVLVITDENHGFAPPEHLAPVQFRPRGDRRDVFRFEAQTSIVPSEYVVRDYNYRTPQVNLTGQAQASAGLGSIVEYGAHVKTPDEATALARIRAEEKLASRRVFSASSDVPALFAGLRFRMEGHPRGDMDLLVTEVEHEIVQVTRGTAAVDGAGYRNEIKAIQSGQPYRPPRVTPRPRIHGVVTGIIDAQERDDYAKIDDQGRYLVRFIFDTHSPTEKQASRWVRMAQPHAGQGYGMHFPLRPGVEVIITFVDGDPDRPIIAATVPNPQTASPVTSGNAPRNIIRTGSGNEINIDDTKDGQRIKLATPFKGTTFQLGSRNAPEDGAILETQGASTHFATTITGGFSALNSTIAAVKNFLTSGQITTVADIDVFATSVSGVRELTGVVLDVLDLKLNQQEADLKKKEGELNVEQILKQKASHDAEKKRTDAEADSQKKLDDLAATVESTSDIEAKKKAYEDAKAEYEAARVLYQTNTEWLTEAKKGEYISDASKTTAEYTLGSNAQVRFYTGEVATSKADMDAKQAAYEAAEKEYLDALKSATPKAPCTAADRDKAAGDCDKAVTARKGAGSAADKAWADADVAKNNYNTQVGLNEMGDKAIEIKKQRQNVGYARTASTLLLSELMALYAVIKELIEGLKADTSRAEATLAALQSIPREDPASLFLAPPVKIPKAGLLGEIKHTLGSEGNTVLYAKEALFSWANKMVIRGKTGVVVQTDSHLSFLSKDKAEVAASKKLVLTSKEIDARGYDTISLVAKPGAIYPAAAGTFTLESKGLFSVESTDNDVTITANHQGNKVALTAEDTVSGGAKNVVFKGTETADLLAGGGANPGWGLKVDGTNGRTTLGNVTGNWKLAIENAKVDLGDATCAVNITSDMARIRKAHSLVKMTGDKTLVASQGKVELNGKGNIVAQGKKILLG